MVWREVRNSSGWLIQEIWETPEENARILNKQLQNAAEKDAAKKGGRK